MATFPEVLIRLDNDINLARHDLDLSYEGDTNRPGLLSDLSNCLWLRYNLTSDQIDLHKAIEAAQQAVNLTPEGHSDYPTLLNNLSHCLSSRYTLTSDKTDLDKATEVAQQAVNLTPEGHDDRPKHLNKLSHCLSSRYALTSDRIDLDKATEIAQQAVNLTPEGHSDRPKRLNNLGNRLLSRYALTSDKTDLDKAIEVTQQAVDLTPDGHSHRPALLNGLGNHISSRYALTSDKTDLDKAIEVTQEAVDLTPEGHSSRPTLLNNLGHCLSSRYGVTSDKTDLDKAIEVTQEAVDLTSEGHNNRPKWLNNLSHCLLSRYTLTSDKTDLDKATEVAQQAVNLTPEDHNNRPTWLNNLSQCLLSRYTLTSDKIDLDKATEVAQQAVDLTPEGHSDRPKWLNNLSNHISSRYALTSDKTDLDKAIEITQEAVDLTPEGHSSRPILLNNLGHCLSSRYALTSDKTDLDKATQSHSEASETLVALVSQRLRAYRALLRIFGDHEKSKEALDAGSSAIELLPALAPRSLLASDKQRVLSSMAGLASDAAAMAVSLGKPLKAVQLLEQGRGVLLGNLMDLRSVPLELEQQYPELAKEFIRLRNRLNMPATSDQPVLPSLHLSPVRQGEARRQANIEFENLLHNIRQQPGFYDFLQPPGEPELLSAASEGPVIFINVSTYRCDALIITEDSIRSVSLPGLAIGDLIRQKAGLSMYGFKDQGVLQWLWDTVVFPILQDLQMSEGRASETLPHIWWIPTGLLSRFPLQAAGHHLEQHSRSLLDIAVSSFASSIRSISRSRSGTIGNPTNADRLVLLAIEKTTGCQPLLFAREESEAIKKLCLDVNLEVVEPKHYRRPVLDALRSCKIFHFVGHGHSHPTDPLQSRLLLDDPREDPLTLASFLETDTFVQPPLLAYLSACSTSQVQNERMLDESLHLVSAFQLAGFQHVIGTLWDVDDELSKEVASLVYETIIEMGMTHESVRLGLHVAIKSCRDRWRSIVLERNEELVTATALSGSSRNRDYGTGREGYGSESGSGYEWAPFVHFGG
jgi:tetratricopeptide (TPR) repeat protein